MTDDDIMPVMLQTIEACPSGHPELEAAWMKNVSADIIVGCIALGYITGAHPAAHAAEVAMALASRYPAPVWDTMTGRIASRLAERSAAE